MLLGSNLEPVVDTGTDKSCQAEEGSFQGLVGQEGALKQLSGTGRPENLFFSTVVSTKCRDSPHDGEGL